jgi:hypothetical protein
MTKIARRRWPGLIALAILALVPIYFFLHHPIGTSLAMAGLSGCGILEHYRRKARIKKLGESRAGESICEFARSFDAKQVDTWVIRAVYEQLQEYLGGDPAVPIRASDRLKDDIPIDLEDLEMDLVADIAKRSRRSLNDTKSNPFFGKVKTVEDLVLFLNAQQKLTT